MAIDEVFPNPTVKRVAFEIRFPNLFMMENKIGDFQTKIMDEYPDSALIHRHNIYFTEIDEDGRIKNKPEDLEPGMRKIWQFKSPKDFVLSVQTDRLIITSELHKSYKNPNAEYRFRDTIDYVLKPFFDIAKIPVLRRIGLRYTDHCPLPDELSNATFKDYYNTVFNLERFNIQDTPEMYFLTVTQKNDYYLRFVERLFTDEKGDLKYIMDFDAYANDIKANNSLLTLDYLHDIIIDEFELAIKEPVLKFMRKPSEVSNE